MTSSLSASSFLSASCLQKCNPQLGHKIFAVLKRKSFCSTSTWLWFFSSGIAYRSEVGVFSRMFVGVFDNVVISERLNIG